MLPSPFVFTQLRAWQACVIYKRAIYAICEVGPGFARFVVIARSPLMEPQDHLIDLVHTSYIDEAAHKKSMTRNR